MLFLAVVVSWFAMQYWGGAAAMQHDKWLQRWSNWLGETSIAQFGTTVVMLILLLVPVISVALVLHLMGSSLFGLMGVAINIVALLFACGRGDCSADVAAYRDALSHRDETTVFNTVQRVFGFRTDNLALLHCRIRSTVAYHQYERWFAPVIWFLLLGAPGAVFYRSCQLLAKTELVDTVPLTRGDGTDVTNDKSAIAIEGSINAQEGSINTQEAATDTQNDSNVQGETFAMKIKHSANALLGWLDWLPVRMWGFLFALAADFSRVYHVLSDQVFERIATIELLDAINLASLHSDDVYDGACFNNNASQTDADIDREKLKIEIMAVESTNQRVMVVGLLMVSLLSILF